VVERTTKRTTRSTTSAALPTGREEGADWITKQRTSHSEAITDEFKRHVREQLAWYREQKER